MPIESESPMYTTFLSVVDMGSGGPPLHVAKLIGVEGGGPPGAGVQL